MYTNIDTTHALDQLDSFFTNSELCSDIAIGPILAALRIVMSHNVFQFGDTWWVQLTGTAMGAPPTPCYATLYFAIHELRCILDQYGKYLLFYRRFLDNIFGAWFCQDPIEDDI